jgi:uncharacterized protein YjbJ (UPF0337 family)
MNKDNIKGTVEEVKGKVKEGLGELTGDERLKREGQVDQIKGQAHKIAADIKDVRHDLIDSAGSRKK